MTTPRKLALLVCLTALPALAGSATADTRSRFGVGVRTGSLGLVSSLRADNTIAMDGGGLHLRFSLSPRFELELSSLTLSGEQAQGALQRDSELATLSALIHLGPRHYRPIDWYLIVGAGRIQDQVTYQRGDRSWATESFAGTHFQMGLGIAHRFFRHLAVAGEWRATGIARDDSQLDQPRYEKIDGPVPWESSGSEFDLVATYYF